MKKYILVFLIFLLLTFSGCTKHDFDFQDPVKTNIENVFGVQFDTNHDWCTTVNSQVTIYANTEKYFNNLQTHIVPVGFP